MIKYKFIISFGPLYRGRLLAGKRIGIKRDKIKTGGIWNGVINHYKCDKRVSICFSKDSWDWVNASFRDFLRIGEDKNRYYFEYSKLF
jgi:hypothetical protein